MPAIYVLHIMSIIFAIHCITTTCTIFILALLDIIVVVLSAFWILSLHCISWTSCLLHSWLSLTSEHTCFICWLNNVWWQNAATTTQENGTLGHRNESVNEARLNYNTWIIMYNRWLIIYIDDMLMCCFAENGIQEENVGTGARLLQKKRLHVQRKVTTISLAVCLIFFITWGPITMVVLASLHTYVRPSALQFMGVTIYLNSMANMIIYCCKSRDYREIIKKLFACKRTQSQNNSSQ